MSAEANKATARRFWEEVSDQRNLALANDLFVPDYQHHDPGLPPQMLTSRDAYIQHLPIFYAAFPDFRLMVDDMMAEGDKVTTRWTFRGTHGGELMGIPPTGKTVSASAITTQHFADGKIVEGWTIFDALGMLQQLGVIPSPGQ